MNECEYEAAARYWTSKENDATRMPGEQLKEAIDDFLTSHNTCALACASGDFVRCTPLEYAYREGAIWIFSEGGLKFAALEHNKNVCLAIYEPYAGFGTLASAQVTGVAKIVDPRQRRVRRRRQRERHQACHARQNQNYAAPN